MEEGELTDDRFDNLARFFDGMWQQLCDDIVSGRFLPNEFGHHLANYWMRVKEFQKRAGNHGHGIAQFLGSVFTAEIVRSLTLATLCSAVKSHSCCQIGLKRSRLCCAAIRVAFSCIPFLSCLRAHLPSNTCR